MDNVTETPKRLLTSEEEEHILKMLSIAKSFGDREQEELAHILADGLLLEALSRMGYSQIVLAFNSISKWYC